MAAPAKALPLIAEEVEELMQLFVGTSPRLWDPCQGLAACGGHSSRSFRAVPRIKTIDCMPSLHWTAKSARRACYTKTNQILVGQVWSCLCAMARGGLRWGLTLVVISRNIRR